MHPTADQTHQRERTRLVIPVITSNAGLLLRDSERSAGSRSRVAAVVINKIFDRPAPVAKSQHRRSFSPDEPDHQPPDLPQRKPPRKDPQVHQFFLRTNEIKPPLPPRTRRKHHSNPIQDHQQVLQRKHHQLYLLYSTKSTHRDYCTRTAQTVPLGQVL